MKVKFSLICLFLWSMFFISGCSPKASEEFSAILMNSHHQQEEARLLNSLIFDKKLDIPGKHKLLEESLKKDDLFVITTGHSLLNIEEKQVQSDGSVKHVLVSKVPLTDDDGNIVGVLGIYTDITDQKCAEELEKKALLLDAAEAKGKAQLEENLRLAVTVVAGRIYVGSDGLF